MLSPTALSSPSRPTAGLFDEPLPKWIRPCLPTLVDKPPVGSQWVGDWRPSVATIIC